MEELSTEHYKNLQKQLERKYGFIYPIEDKKSFFIGVADYVNLVEHSDVLRGIVIHFILDKRNELDKKITSKTELVVKEVKGTYKKVLEIIEKNKIEDDRVKYSISEYEGFLNGRIQISGYGNFGTYLSDKVRDIILTLEAIGAEDKVKHFGIYDHNKLRVGWKIAPSESELEELLSQRREEKDLSVWGAWEDLWWVYDVVFNKNERWKEIRAKEHNTMESINYSLWVGKVKNALNMDKIDTSPLDMTEYKRHLFRVNDKLQSILDDVITASEKESQKVEASEDDHIEYDKASHSLIVSGHSIEFKKDDSNQAELCRILFENKGSVKKSWDREEILEGWGYPEDQILGSDGKLLKSNRLKAYQTAEKINTKVMKATAGKVLELLIYSTKTVSVNPKYRSWVSFKNVS